MSVATAIKLKNKKWHSHFLFLSFKILLAIMQNICYHTNRSLVARVTGAVVAHRTLNPLALGSNPRSPIIEIKKRYVLHISFLLKQQGRAIALPLVVITELHP